MPEEQEGIEPQEDPPKIYRRKAIKRGAKIAALGAIAIGLPSASFLGRLMIEDTLKETDRRAREWELGQSEKVINLNDKPLIPEDTTDDVFKIVQKEYAERFGVLGFGKKDENLLKPLERIKDDYRYRADFPKNEDGIEVRIESERDLWDSSLVVSYTDHNAGNSYLFYYGKVAQFYSTHLGGRNPTKEEAAQIDKRMPEILINTMNNAIKGGDNVKITETYRLHPAKVVSPSAKK